MGFKALFGLTVIPAAIIGATVMACISRRVRDGFFLIIVFCSPLIERMDVNFVSREWYRGTSRGFEFSVLDVLAIALLVSSVLFPREGETRGFWPASLAPMLLLFFYACGNVAASTPTLFGYFELFRMARGIILVLGVAFYIRSAHEIRLLILALATLVCYEGLLALEQRYVEGLHRVPGTIDDSNSLSVFVCLTAPVLVAALNSRISAFLKALCAAGIALACVAEILTISRAGLIIIATMLLGATAATISYHVTPRKVALCCLIPLAAAGLMAKSWKTLSTRFHSSNLEEEYGNHHNLGRGYYIRVAEAIVADHPFGIGLNNWSYRVSNEYGPRLGYRFVPYRGVDKEPSDVIPPNSNVDEAQAAPAHCLAALTAGELGYPGLILFGWIWLRWFQMSGSFIWKRSVDPMRRLPVGIFFGFGGIFLQSITEWVFRQLPIYYVHHVLLGALASLYYLRRKEQKEAVMEEIEAAEPFQMASS
jgi:hypothetical protein